MRFLGLLLLVVSCLYAGRAAAHTRSESFGSWFVDGAMIRGSVTIPDLEAKRVSSAENGGELIRYLTDRLGLSANGKACPLSGSPHAVNAKPGFRRIEFVFACPSAKDIILTSNAFFDLVPTHVTLVQIQTPSGDFVEQLLTDSDRTLRLDAPAGEGLENASFLSYIGMGVMHIFTGLDHQSFLLGLVLISRRLRDLVFVITGFTLGHSLTLALAVTGIIRPHAEFIDALVALTIILIGVDNVTVSTRRPVMIASCAAGLLLVATALRLLGVGLLPPALLLGSALFSGCYLMISGTLYDAGRLRLVVTLIFGLIHGFGFAADLLQNDIPVGRLAELLVGFNLGVEVGQLTLVFAALGLVALLARARLTLPRPIVVDIAAGLLVAVGMNWFIIRAFA